MGSSILGTKLSLMVAYASRAPSGDHQWATWERKISSVRVSTRMRIRSKSVISHQHITAAEPPLGSSVRCWKQWPHFIGRVEPFVNVPSQFWLQKKKKRHQHKYFKNVSKNIPLVFTASCLTWFYFSVQAQSNCRLSVLSFCSTHTYTHTRTAVNWKTINHHRLFWENQLEPDQSLTPDLSPQQIQAQSDI